MATFHCPSLRSTPVKWIPQLAVIGHGGSPARLFKDICDRVLPLYDSDHFIATPAAFSAPPAAATGPP